MLPGAGTFFAYHNDHLGTPLYVTDHTQAVVWEADYYPFGKIKNENRDPDGDGKAVIQPFRFPGQYEDFETGLYYNYFRDYDPVIGRYIEADPIGQAGGMNVFSYAEQNPQGFFDFNGLTSYEVNIDLLAGGEGLGGGIGYISICEAVCTNNERDCALYWFWGGGITIAPMPIGKIKTKYYFDDGRPSHLEPDFSSFNGFTAFGGATAAVGPIGGSLTRQKMGDHDMNSSGYVTGLDGSFDAFLGSSYQIGHSWTECCSYKTTD